MYCILQRQIARYLSEGGYCLSDIQAGTFRYIMFRKENILMPGALEKKTEYLGAVLCCATDPRTNMMLSLLASISLPIVYPSYLLMNNYLFL